jgi:hypothetical protein
VQSEEWKSNHWSLCTDASRRPSSRHARERRDSCRLGRWCFGVALRAFAQASEHGDEFAQLRERDPRIGYLVSYAFSGFDPLFHLRTSLGAKTESEPGTMNSTRAPFGAFPALSPRGLNVPDQAPFCPLPLPDFLAFSGFCPGSNPVGDIPPSARGRDRSLGNPETRSFERRRPGRWRFVA